MKRCGRGFIWEGKRSLGKKIKSSVGMIDVPRLSVKLRENVSVSLDGTAEQFGSSLQVL